MIIYCRRCVLPHTKPDLYIDEAGICSACRYFAKDNKHWDCVIPVSGGKDSTFQVLKVLQYGMRPLCVTATTCDLSEIGRKNIENLKNAGVDYIEFTANPTIRKKLNRLALIEVGDISWPEHVSIFTVPIIMAVKFEIPLIIWGENSQNEYGGTGAAAKNNYLTRRWLEEFGGLLGLRVADLVNYGFSEKDLIP